MKHFRFMGVEDEASAKHNLKGFV